MQKISVLGLGYIGLPTAITFAMNGCTVRGVDIKQTSVDLLQQGILPIEEEGLEEALHAAQRSGRLTFDTSLVSSDAYIITVQTPQRKGADGIPVSDLSYVRSAAIDVGHVLQAGQLVILESTVPPKTTQMVQDVLCQTSGLSASDFHVAHCPERVIPVRFFIQLRENDRIIGADTAAALNAARALYSLILTKGRIRTTNAISAEMCKLSENTFRDINIAYANELSVICHKLGVNVYELIELANCHPRVNILSPGVGVGGHCIAVDPWFIHEAFPEDARLIGIARQVNDQKPAFLAARIAEVVPVSRRICVMGLAYKPDVDDLRESPSIEVCRLLAEQGFTVVTCEPHVTHKSVKGFDNLTLADVLANDDYLVMAMGHKVFLEMRADLSKRDMYDCIGFLKGISKV